MAKTAIVTDSNSGITQREGKEAGIFVLPMPFLINDTSYFEDINLTQEEFYVHLRDAAANVSTSQPSIGDLLDFWNDILKEYDEIVHIPMSSGLSQSCATATALAKDFGGKIHVVNNQRISVTLKESVFDHYNEFIGFSSEVQKMDDSMEQLRRNLNRSYKILDSLKVGTRKTLLSRRRR